MSKSDSTLWEGSTILTVRKGDKVIIAGDGQLSKGALILKTNVKSVRRLEHGNVIVGFTGATADAVMLFEKFESFVGSNPHQLIRACVDLAKLWRKDPHLSRINAMMIVINPSHSLLLTPDGDVLEKEDGVIGIGAGGPYAYAAARALLDIDHLSSREIAEKSMNIAAEMCIFTNKNVIYEEINIE